MKTSECTARSGKRKGKRKRSVTRARGSSAPFILTIRGTRRKYLPILKELRYLQVYICPYACAFARISGRTLDYIALGKIRSEYIFFLFSRRLTRQIIPPKVWMFDGNGDLLYADNLYHCVLILLISTLLRLVQIGGTTVWILLTNHPHRTRWL